MTVEKFPEAFEHARDILVSMAGWKKLPETEIVSRLAERIAAFANAMVTREVALLRELAQAVHASGVGHNGVAHVTDTIDCVACLANRARRMTECEAMGHAPYKGGPKGGMHCYRCDALLAAAPEVKP